MMSLEVAKYCSIYTPIAEVIDIYEMCFVVMVLLGLLKWLCLPPYYCRIKKSRAADRDAPDHGAVSFDILLRRGPIKTMSGVLES